MKKALILSVLVALALGGFAAVLAGEGEGTKKEVKLTGYITDEWCGAKNAGAEGADCARDCAKKGSKLAIFSDGKLYILSDKEAALANLGYKVIVTGTLDDAGVVQVSSIEKAEEKKA